MRLLKVFEHKQICSKGRVSRAGPREINQEHCPIQGVEKAERDVGAAGWQATRRLVLCMEDLNQCRTSQRGKTLVSREVGLLFVLFTDVFLMLGHSWPQYIIFGILPEGMTVELSHSDSQNSLLDCYTQNIHRGALVQHLPSRERAFQDCQ